MGPHSRRGQWNSWNRLAPSLPPSLPISVAGLLASWTSSSKLTRPECSVTASYGLIKQF